ncbi:uncharacterized protein LOC129581648 [Paramacrobiotus metropolitanus]|uniref:uncharacterized protein LOC129581648 n=1 Tax=Paramacrobiotus metropolitanus TaxID=2943436 RepID=UPI0024457481|nr:uncharacterized protein LOC129581648 [Paramacrobiotus metropolitanus]
MANRDRRSTSSAFTRRDQPPQQQQRRSPESSSRSSSQQQPQQQAKHDQRPARASSRRSSPGRAMGPFRRDSDYPKNSQPNSRMINRNYRENVHRKEPLDHRRNSRRTRFNGFNGNTQQRHPPPAPRRALLATPPHSPGGRQHPPRRPYPGPHHHQPQHNHPNPYYRHARPARARPPPHPWTAAQSAAGAGGPLDGPARHPSGPPDRPVDFFEYDDFPDHSPAAALKIKAEHPTPHRLSRWDRDQRPGSRKHETEPISEDEGVRWTGDRNWEGDRKRSHANSPVDNDSALGNTSESLHTDDEDPVERVLYIDADSQDDQVIETADSAQTSPADCVASTPAVVTSSVPAIVSDDAAPTSVDAVPIVPETPDQVLDIVEDLVTSSVDDSGPTVTAVDQPPEPDAQPDTDRLLSDVSTFPEPLVSPASPTPDAESDMECDVFEEASPKSVQPMIQPMPIVQPIKSPSPKEPVRMFRKKMKPIRRRAASCPLFEPDEHIPLRSVKKKEEEPEKLFTERIRELSPVSDVGEAENSFEPQLLVPPLSALETYVFPQISSGYFNLDPLHTVRSKLTPSTPVPAGIIASGAAAFIEILDRLNSDADLSSEYDTLFSHLQTHLQCAVEYFNWFSPADPVAEQLGVQFVNAMKSYLAETKSSPTTALEVLLSVMLRVEGVPEWMGASGLVDALLECGGVAGNVLEAWMVLVGKAKDVLMRMEPRMKKVAGGRRSAFVGLWELRMSVEAAVEIRWVQGENGGNNAGPIMKARLDGIYGALETLLTKITDYRNLQREPTIQSFLDPHAAIIACLDQCKFLPWLADIHTRILELDQRDITVWRIRKLISDLLDTLLHNELTGAYLLKKSIKNSTKILFDGLVRSGDNLESLRTAQKMATAMETVRCIDQLIVESYANTPEMVTQLASLVQTDVTAGIAANVLTGKCCQGVLRHLMEKAERVRPVFEILVNGVICQPERGVFLIECLGELAACYQQREDMVQYCALTCAGVLAKEFRHEPVKARFFQWVVRELGTLQIQSINVPDSVIYVLLDTCVYCLTFCLKSQERVALALQGSGAVVFVNLLKSVRVVIESILISTTVQPASPSLNIQLWESAWINCAKIFALAVLSGVIPDSLAILTFTEMVSFSCRAELPVRDGCRTAVQKELARGLKEIVRQTLCSLNPDALYSSDLYKHVHMAMCAATAPGQPLASLWAYLAIVNRLRPDNLHTAPDIVSDEWIRRRNNWEALVRLDFTRLKCIICYGLSTSIGYADADFRLWLWRYCEMSAPAAYEAVSVLWWTCTVAIKDGLHEEKLALILQKLAALLRVDIVRTVSLYLLQPRPETTTPDGPLEYIDNPIGWHPKMFDYFLTLLSTAPLYTKNNQLPSLHPVLQIITALLPPWAPPHTPPTLQHHVPAIISAVLARLETKPSIPLLATCFPFFHILPYYPDVFLTKNAKKPLLNRLLLELARELRADPRNPAWVVLAHRLVAVFRDLGAGGRVEWPEVRSMAGMVVAYTRGYDRQRPTYRLIQNLDPERAAVGDGEPATPEVAEFVGLVKRMLGEFAAEGKKGKGKEKEKEAGKGKEMVEWFRTYVEEMAGLDGAAYERWQQEQVDQAVYMYSSQAVTDKKPAVAKQPLVLLNDAMKIEKMLSDWMRRQSGPVASTSTAAV